ncbi:UbiA family prenyltransferase [Methylomonas sp. SURF-1]|uniref:UbiA family prenyltransferase n=1 Tax=Methylomonas aurea TaxID=2952224 RepID=A0ABT1UKH1_9GAMM|nr:UbiA family prenyltransferase [Methylomonas sp. SURF-1]
MTNSALAPLVVDLDGTLIRTDTLVESIILLLKRKPLCLILMVFWLLSGRAYFKSRIANSVELDVRLLPYRDDLLEYLQAAKNTGRHLILATAAHKTVAERVAAHLGFFDMVLGSDGSVNLKGRVKLAAIQSSVGPEFVYAGDSGADLPIWQQAQAAILVNSPARVARVVRATCSVEREFFETGNRFYLWIRAMRVHQWLKNLLLFVPLLTAFSFREYEKIAMALCGFFAFSLAASATYMGNDMWDLESDRRHPRKKSRPFACGSLPLIQGLVVAAAFLSLGLLLAFKVSLAFMSILVVYLIVTTSYTWCLKTYVLIDVLVLSLLYSLRIFAGSVAADVLVSFWLLAFSVFIFFSLALVKRCSELLILEQQGRSRTNGRDYQVSDLVVLWPLGVGSALSSVVVFGLFICANETQARYATPNGLWLVAVGITYWLSRLWIKTSRGEMDDDPLVFAVRDFGSRVTIAAMIAATLAARFLNWG